MTKLKPDEDKQDGLEITSIGSLYSGSWEKKYWSSSRGKDRYPYPVGYRAVRAHNGSTYKMEICEGPKGPVFMITSADGLSSSGQTPDISWDKFQKKYCPRIKIWHGKRFSCNIDGVEFFGFKNPFVLRLLRELVANVSGSAEKSSSCKESPKADTINNLSDTSKSHDVMPCLEKPKITGKRNRRCQVDKTVSSDLANPKRWKSKDLKYAVKALDTVQEKQNIHGIAKSLHSSKNESVSSEQKSASAHETKDHIAENEFPCSNVDDPNELRNIISAEGTRLLADSQCCTSAGLVGYMTTETKPLGRLEGTEAKDLAISMELDEKDTSLTTSGSVQVLNDVNLFVPDTLDIDQGDFSTNNGGPSSQEKVNNQLKEESTASDLITSEALVTGQEEETLKSNSNADSGKSDFDSVGQETAKSMMSFLLPQAIPLLKKTSRKKKRAITKENNTTSSAAVMPAVCEVTDVKKHINVQQATVDGKFDILDHSVARMRDDQVHFRELSLSGDTKSNQIMEISETCVCNKCGQSNDNEKHNDSSDCCLEPTCSKDIFCYDEVQNDTSVSLVKRADDLNACLDEKDLIVPDSVGFATESTNDELKDIVISSDVQPEKSRIQTEAAESGKIPVIRSPSLVYTRRKKVQTKSQPKGQYHGPLSESIICRSSGDRNITDTCPVISNLTMLVKPEMVPAKDNSCEKYRSGAQPKVLREPESLIEDCPKLVVSKTPQSNTGLAVTHDQSFIHSSEDIETVEFLEQLDSQVRKFTVHADEETVEGQNLLVQNFSESSQRQGKSFSNNSSVLKDFQHVLDSEPKGISIRNDLLSMFKPVGCYNHPLPVVSLMVSSGGSEVHICVVCGLLDGKERTLFMYKVATQEPTLGNPTFIGHTIMTLPILKDYFGREISVETSGFQFTPGGDYLVSLDSIKMPYCRQGRISCLCSACGSGSLDSDTVKVVKVDSGYVSIVGKLKAVESLLCILVCEPNHLVAVGESGRLHLWVMNLAWSAQTERVIMPTNDVISPGIVELKKIPRCDSLVICHNGFGEFSLWDISKRVIVSKFSGASTSICDFLPVGLFSWKKKGQSSGAYDVDGDVNTIMAESNSWFAELKTNGSVLPEDTAVWLLISAASDYDTQRSYSPGSLQPNSAGFWRLALLVKNTVLSGSTLDPSATVIGALNGHGITGTSDGLVYIWDMTTGAKLGTLHHFKGSSVSCIATVNNAKKGPVVIADVEGFVYTRNALTEPHFLPLACDLCDEMKQLPILYSYLFVKCHEEKA